MDKNKVAIQLMQEQKYEEAATLFNELINENPNDPIGYINFGNLLLHISDFTHAQGFFEKAIELNSNTATAYYGLGNLFFEQSLYEEAQINFQKAIELGLDAGDVYYMLGMTCKNLGNDKLALPYLLRATELEPEDDELLFQYGLALAQTDYISDAKSSFEKVLQLNQQHSDAHYNLGVIALFQDNPQAALNHFNEAIAIQPDHILAANGKEKVKAFL